MPIETNVDMRAYWPRWAEFIHNHGLGSLIAWALEAAGPLALLGAQVFHFGSPLLRPAVSGNALDGFITLFENEAERRSFVAFLREARET
jgi:hypothetical protein